MSIREAVHERPPWEVETILLGAVAESLELRDRMRDRTPESEKLPLSTDEPPPWLDTLPEVAE